MLWPRTCAAEGYNNRRTSCCNAQAGLKGEGRLCARASENKDRCTRSGTTRCDTTLGERQREFGDRVAPTRKQLLRGVPESQRLRLNASHCRHRNWREAAVLAPTRGNGCNPR